MTTSRLALATNACSSHVIHAHFCEACEHKMHVASRRCFLYVYLFFPRSYLAMSSVRCSCCQQCTKLMQPLQEVRTLLLTAAYSCPGVNTAHLEHITAAPGLQRMCARPCMATNWRLATAKTMCNPHASWHLEIFNSDEHTRVWTSISSHCVA